MPVVAQFESSESHVVSPHSSLATSSLSTRRKPACPQARPVILSEAKDLNRLGENKGLTQTRRRHGTGKQKSRQGMPAVQNKNAPTNVEAQFSTGILYHSGYTAQVRTRGRRRKENSRPAALKLKAAAPGSLMDGRILNPRMVISSSF